MAYDFTFIITPPISEAAFNNWHDSLGDAAPLAYSDDGKHIVMSGSYSGTGRYLTTYWPQLRAWAERNNVKVTFDWGDYQPEGFEETADGQG